MKTINTKQAFSLLNLINKMDLRKKLIDMIKQQTKTENKKQMILTKLYSTVEQGTDVTNELVIELFSQNIELHEEYKLLEEQQQETGMEFLFDIVEALPKAEKEFYKAAASIFDTTQKEIEEKNVVEVIQDIIDIFKSESFMGFFSSMNK